MQTAEIIASLDAEISRLEQVRELLSGVLKTGGTGKRRGRPKGSRNKASIETPKSAAKSLSISVAGKARIAAAQKRDGPRAGSH